MHICLHFIAVLCLCLSHVIYKYINMRAFETIKPYFTVHFHPLRRLEKLKAVQEMQFVAWHRLFYTFYRAPTFTGTMNHIQLCDLLKQCAQMKLWPEQQYGISNSQKHSSAYIFHKQALLPISD